MNNIEKQAERFGMEEDDGFAVMNADKRDGFKDSAEWMRQELTRWHDIRTEFPEFRQELLLKLKRKNGKTFHRVGWMAGERIFAKYVRGAEVVAWRYIHQ